MDTTKQVRAAILYAGKLQQDVAEAFGVTPQCFGQRLNKGTLRPADLERIAEAIGAEYVSLFRFPDGTEI